MWIKATNARNITEKIIVNSDAIDCFCICMLNEQPERYAIIASLMGTNFGNYALGVFYKKFNAERALDKLYSALISSRCYCNIIDDQEDELNE